MEIHHHPRRENRKWVHYVFDFFMLFLAVFFGYLAESRLEHKTEDSREFELMQALVVDLRSDIAQIDAVLVKRNERNRNCDSLINMLTNPLLVKNPQSRAMIYLIGRNASRRIHFRPQDGTLKQLRNAGGFRVIHDSTVLLGVNSYELRLSDNEENIEVEEKELTEYTMIAAKVFSARVFQQMGTDSIIHLPPGSPALISYDPALLNELSIKLHYWKRTSVSIVERLKELRETATDLVREILARYKKKK